MKIGQVTPLLKKPGRNTKYFKNFRSITNLTTISKIIERLALHRVRPYLSTSPNHCRLQSAYPTGQSTETALVKIVNDILEHINKGSVVMLVSLDISAAFDMVNHNLLLLLDETSGERKCRAYSSRSFTSSLHRRLCVGWFMASLARHYNF